MAAACGTRAHGESTYPGLSVAMGLTHLFAGGGAPPIAVTAYRTKRGEAAHSSGNTSTCRRDARQVQGTD